MTKGAKDSDLTFSILSEEGLNELRAWLMARESDIAYDWEDFGDLRGLFKALIGREPKK